MASYILGYGGKWQERFDDPDAAVRVAETVAETGVVVEVVRRRFGFHSFFTAFPESEREALHARWKLQFGFGGDGGSGNVGHHHHHAYNSIGAHGGFGGGGHHGGGHGGH